MEGKNKKINNKIYFINSYTPRYELYKSKKVLKLFNKILEKQGGKVFPSAKYYFLIFKRIYKNSALKEEEKLSRIYEFIRNFLNSEHWQADFFQVLLKLKGYESDANGFYRIGIHRISFSYFENSFIKGNKITIRTNGDFLINLSLLNTVPRLKDLMNLIHIAVYEQFFNPNNTRFLTTEELERLWVECVSDLTFWDLTKIKYLNIVGYRKWDLYEFYNGVLRRLFLENYKLEYYDTPTIFTMQTRFTRDSKVIESWFNESFYFKNLGRYKVGASGPFKKTFKVFELLFTNEQLEEFRKARFYKVFR